MKQEMCSATTGKLARFVLHLMAGAAFVVPWNGASAQEQVSADPDQVSDDSGRGVEEIIVTARRSEERLQDVPLAVVAYSDEELARRSVRDLTDVATLTPGLNFESYGGSFGTPVIRGAAQGRIQDLDQNVSTFFEGIYLPRQYLISPGVIGLERIEIVKGPQSALYGRNAFMGAINYVTRKPGNEWAGEVEGTAGLYDRYDVIGEIRGPIVPDHMFLRLGAGYSSFDGDVRNQHPKAGADIDPGSPGRLGGWENKAFQARLVVRPFDTLEFDAAIYHFELFQEQPPSARLQRTTGDTNCGNLIAGRPALYCGEIPWQFRPLPGSSGRGPVNVDPRVYSLDAESTIVRAAASWAPTEEVNIIYEYGRVTADAVGGGNADRDPTVGSANPFSPSAPRGNQFQILPVGDMAYQSHELRVEFKPTAGLDFLVGAITSKLRDTDRFLLHPALPLLGTAPFDINGPGFFTLSRGTTTVKTKGIFGRVNLDVTDRLRIGAEARYATEDKTLVSGPSSFNALVRTLEGEWKQFTPRVTIDYKITDDNLLYATAAKGSKSGGFNLSALVPAQFQFDPDKNWTYEVGSKNSFLDGRLRLNGALFYVDWSNQQVSCSAEGGTIGVPPPAVICNLGKATVKGAELDATFAVTDALTLNGGVSYNDATFNDGVVDQRLRDLRLCDDVVCARSGDISGNQLPRQSKWQWVVGANFEAPVSAAIRAFASGDVSYKSLQYADTANAAFLPARTLANARLGVRTDSWELSAWVKNLFDLDYAASAFVVLVAPDTNIAALKGAGRTAGLTSRFNF